MIPGDFIQPQCNVLILEAMIYVETEKIHDLLNAEVGYVGTEVLVDRLWPRGVKKDSVELQAWLKGVAPSPELRRWFGHESDKFEQFGEAYKAELDERAASLDNAQESPELRDLAELLERAKQSTEGKPLVLVYAARDRRINHAVILADWLYGNVQ